MEAVFQCEICMTNLKVESGPAYKGCLIKIFETGPLYGLLCVYGLWLNLFHRNGPMYVL